MALIRVVRPGYPVDPDLFIDLGAARGRVSLATSGILGGPIEYLTPIRPTMEAQTLKRLIERDYPRCGQMLRTGTPCVRRPGHADTHRTAEAVARDNARRRARDFG